MNDPRQDSMRSIVHEAVQTIRGLDPDQPQPDPVARLAWDLETDGGRLHPLDVVARGSLHPALKVRGFRRKRDTWYRRSGELVQVINLQGSRFNSLGRDVACLYIINVGVFLPELHEVAWREPARDDFPWRHSQLQFQLTELTGNPAHVVLSLEPDRSLEQQGEELVRWVIEAGLSHLDGLASIAALYPVLQKALESGSQRFVELTFAFVAARVGERAEAERVLRSYYGRLGRERQWQERAERVAQHLGIELQPLGTESRSPDSATAATGAPPPEIAAGGAATLPAVASEKPRLIPRHVEASPWVLELTGCADLDETNVVATAERLAALGLVPAVHRVYGEPPELVDDLPGHLAERHEETELWRRWKATRRKLSRLRVSESWSFQTVRPGLNWGSASVSLTRHGRDNWVLFIWANTWIHADVGVTIEEYAASWADLLLEIAEDLRPRLRPRFGILYATGSYFDLLEDLEAGRLVVGWRTWYSPALAERHGRDLLLQLPDHAEALADGSIAHRLDVSPGKMVLPRAGKYGRLRSYLQARGVVTAWPRLRSGQQAVRRRAEPAPESGDGERAERPGPDR